MARQRGTGDDDDVNDEKRAGRRRGKWELKEEKH